MARGYRFGVVGSISTVPDGSTVLPINDIDLLLQCAGIKGSTITTLAELFADTTTLQAVINSNNAIDYLVRSTEFAKSEALVPTMTGYTTPIGQVIYSAVYDSGQPLWYVFDGNNNTYGAWTNTIGGYVGYKFTESKCVKRVFIKSNYSGYTDTYKIQGSNDNSTWVDISSFTMVSGTTEYDITLNNSTSYLYYRLYQTTKNGSSSGIGLYTLQFFANEIEEGFCDNSTAMTDIGANNYASNTLLANSTWLNAICNSTYFESVLNVKVPTMTSNNTPSGECFADYVNTDAYKAFDGNMSDTWGAGYGIRTAYIGYQFTSSVRVCKVSWTDYNQQRTGTYKIQGSNDNEVWEDLISGTAVNISETINFVNLSSFVYYRMYHIQAIDNIALNLQLYGRQDV